MLHPSLPPRPSFPKSPSPQENTKPNKHQTAGQTMITVVLRARKLLEQDIPTFICQSESLSISASTSNLNYSVAKEHFNLQNRKKMFQRDSLYFKSFTNVFKLLQLILFFMSSLSVLFRKALIKPHLVNIQHCSVTTVASSYVSK